LPDALERALERGLVLLLADRFRQRDVQVEAAAAALAALVLVAREVRIGRARMTVDRDGQHVGAVVEDVLRAVAVVIVDVEHGDAAALAQPMRGGGRTVEIAEAAEAGALGVMARRA